MGANGDFGHSSIAAEAAARKAAGPQLFRGGGSLDPRLEVDPNRYGTIIEAMRRAVEKHSPWINFIIRAEFEAIMLVFPIGVFAEEEALLIGRAEFEFGIKTTLPSGQKLLTYTGKLADHHIMPRQFEKFFAARGIEIDKYTISVDHI